MVARDRIELPTRGFSAVIADSRGFVINHLQRLPAPTPASPRHIHGTPNLSSTHSWHRASRSAASQLALERCEISGKTERQLVGPLLPFRSVLSAAGRLRPPREDPLSATAPDRTVRAES